MDVRVAPPVAPVAVEQFKRFEMAENHFRSGRQFQLLPPSFQLGRLARQSILHNTNFLSPLPSCIRRGNNQDGNKKHPITTPLPPLARCELPSSQGVAHNALWDNRGSVEPSHLARQRFVPPSLLRVLFLLHLIDAVGISSTEEEEEISRFIDRGIK